MTELERGREIIQWIKKSLEMEQEAEALEDNDTRREISNHIDIEVAEFELLLKRNPEIAQTLREEYHAVTGRQLSIPEDNDE